jgi:hypothetical protein
MAFAGLHALLKAATKLAFKSTTWSVLRAGESSN